MKPTYLTHSRVAHVSLAAMLLAFVLKTVVVATSLPIWLVPVCYFVALAASGVLFVGWVRWRSPSLGG
jgi:hypothetical protein